MLFSDEMKKNRFKWRDLGRLTDSGAEDEEEVAYSFAFFSAHTLRKLTDRLQSDYRDSAAADRPTGRHITLLFSQSSHFARERVGQRSFAHDPQESKGKRVERMHTHSLPLLPKCVCPIFVSRSAVERKSLCSTRQLRDTTASEDAFTSATVCQSASNQQSRLILKCWSMLLFLLLLSILRLFSFF